MGKDVKVVQVLDAAGKDIDRELADEPDVLARAHESMAWVYGSRRRRPPICMMSVRSPIACMTDPAPRKRPALKKACVKR